MKKTGLLIALFIILISCATKSGIIKIEKETDTKENTNKDLTEDRSGIYSENIEKLDLPGPDINVQSLSDVFSPNNDGNLDYYVVEQSGSDGNKWKVQIFNCNSGNIVFEKKYENNPDPEFVWDGRDENGNLMPNGKYEYLITGTNSEGLNSDKKLYFELKNLETTVSLKVNKDKMSLSENEKNLPSIKFYPFLNVKEDFENYRLEIYDSDKKLIKTFAGEKDLPQYIEWFGRNNEKYFVKDGTYSARFSAYFRFGNNPQTNYLPFIIDSTPPEAEISYFPEYFSQDGDGTHDELLIKIKSNENYGTGIKRWKLSILNQDQTEIFKYFSGEGYPPENILWDGKGENGSTVESAEYYPVKFIAEDEAGNINELQLEPLKTGIMVTGLPGGRLKIKIDNINFKPDSSELIDPDKNQEIIDLLAFKLKSYDKYKLIIEGHANKYFNNNLKYNKALAFNLSLARAKKIFLLLKAQGIDKKRIKIVGKGGEIPLVFPDNNSEIKKFGY
jgi:outer membrane protein OmpA-like peptidoglycan-associated protein